MERTVKLITSKRENIFLTYLKATHVPRIPGVFQAVLIALQKEFEEKPNREREKN